MNTPTFALMTYAQHLYQAVGARILAASPSASPSPSGSNSPPPSSGKNPFDKVVPDFTVFGADFTSWWQKLLGGAWAIALVLCAFHLLSAGASLRSNKKNGYQTGVIEDTQELKTWGVGAGVTIGAGVIFGAAVAIFG